MPQRVALLGSLLLCVVARMTGRARAQTQAIHAEPRPEHDLTIRRWIDGALPSWVETKPNVIPDDVKLQPTVRSFSDATRTRLLDGIAQLARDNCAAFRCPKPPEVRVNENYTPAVYVPPGAP